MNVSTQPDITALILAGGRARRLGGRNKALLRVDGITLLDRLHAELAPRVSRILVSVAEPVTWTELPTVVDGSAGLGPLSGIGAGLALAPSWLLAVAVDMPFLCGPVLDLLLRHANPDVDGAAFCLRFPEPLVALWGPACRAVVERRIARGDLKVAEALQDPELRITWIDEAAVRAVDPTLRAFANINDAADVAAL
jgi:molybdenum cofactor guanylyltransferase